MVRLLQEKIKQPLAEELLFGKLSRRRGQGPIKDNAPAFEDSGAAQGAQGEEAEVQDPVEGGQARRLTAVGGW